MRLPEALTLSRLEVRFPDGEPPDLDPELTLLLYVEDATLPRARIRLADLLGPGNARPLNIKRRPGQLVRLVLDDPHGAWAGNAPRLDVTLA